MNKDRRTQLQEAAALLAAGAEQIRQARDLVDGVKDEEAEALEAMPEGLKNADKGQEMEAAISQLSEAVDNLDSIALEDIGRALEDAAGRDVSAELPPAKLTKAEAEQRRYDRLPEWAKARIAKLQDELASVQEQAREVYPEPGPDSFTVEDFMSPHKGRALPFDRIQLRDIVVEVSEHQGGISLHTNKGRLVIVPQVSNQVFVRAEPHR